MKLRKTTWVLSLGLTSLGCTRDQEPRTAQSAERTPGEVGAEAGEAMDEAAQDMSERAQETVDDLGLQGRHRYRCATGEEFFVEFRNDGQAALIEKDSRQYWLDLEQGTGRYSSRDARFWTIEEEVASLELKGQPPMRNCARQ
jgi:hypothetical protein